MRNIKTAAIILAAGASRRLGSPKQLAMVAGERLLERAVRSCQSAGLQLIVIVLGANAARIQQECDLTAATVVVNDNWNSGQASSIRRGLEAIIQNDIEAAVLMTCDMPFVTAKHLQALVALAEETHRNTASQGEQWQGVPACFLGSSFAHLLALEGDTGARKLLRDAPSVQLNNCLDVDTPENLRRANEIAAR